MHRVVTGLGFGDEGKGATVDFLARTGVLLGVRFNGGLQAGHNVVCNGVHHTFSQYASCLLVPATRSILASAVYVDPFAMQVEAARLKQAGVDCLDSRASASENCILVTPFHRTMNRIRELARGENRHGSCGVGIGEAFRDLNTSLCMRLRDLTGPDLTGRLEAQRLARLAEAREIAASIAENMREKSSTGQIHSTVQEYLADLENPNASSYIAERYAAFMESRVVQIVEDSRILEMISVEPAVFEGAQGFLLDMEHGFFPHVTPSCTDASGALRLIAEAGAGECCVIGVMRSYLTRHGEGPFPTESRRLLFEEPHNSGDSHQGRFRRGAFDLPLLEYALEKSVQVDALAITHLDAFPGEWPVCVRYSGGPIEPRAESLLQIHPEIQVLPPGEMIHMVESRARRPIVLVSDGPGPEARRFRHSAAQSTNTFHKAGLSQAPAHNPAPQASEQSNAQRPAR